MNNLTKLMSKSPSNAETNAEKKLEILSKEEQTEIKGGVLVCGCNEKRIRRVSAYSYTY